MGKLNWILEKGNENWECVFWDYYELLSKGGSKREKDRIKVDVSNKIVLLMKENEELKSKITE